MCAPLWKSVHQIVSVQEIQLSFTWAASIIPSFRWLWHGSNFWGRSSSCSLIPSSGALVSMDIYPLLSIVFHTCRVHCKDNRKKKVLIPEQCWKILAPLCQAWLCWGILRGWSPRDGCRCWGWPSAGASRVFWAAPQIVFLGTTKNGDWPAKREPQEPDAVCAAVQLDSSANSDWIHHLVLLAVYNLGVQTLRLCGSCF